jgi:EAL domain-containing protein (putative c-di-GMP-specific phosphodiesterase class I)
VTVDFLKLDRSFIAAIPQDDGARKMAHAVIQLAHSLGMEPIARRGGDEGAAKVPGRQGVPAGPGVPVDAGSPGG